MGMLVLAAALGVVVSAAVFLHLQRRYQREHHIRSYVFPRGVLDGLKEAYPHLDEKGVFLAARALRMFFLVHLRAQGRTVGMPSKAVDALWHAFILDTRAYQAFCRRAFGSFFHHLPAARMDGGKKSEEALYRTWRLACLEENIRPEAPTRLPLLFAIDEKLAIPGAHHFSAAGFIRRARDQGSSGCGGGGSHGCSGDGGGCGGGCGGS